MPGYSNERNHELESWERQVLGHTCRAEKQCWTYLSWKGDRGCAYNGTPC